MTLPDCNADNSLTMTVVVGMDKYDMRMPVHVRHAHACPCTTCACLSMYAYLCTRRGKAWLPGNAAWDITCDILLVYIAASNAKTASVHISGNTTQAGLQQQDQAIIADAYKHVRLPDGLPAAGSAGLFSASPRAAACSFGKPELLLPEAELLLRLLSESNSESLSCEDSRSPQLASQGWGSLASALRLGVVGAAGCVEGSETGRSGDATKADSCRVMCLLPMFEMQSAWRCFSLSVALHLRHAQAESSQQFMDGMRSLCTFAQKILHIGGIRMPFVTTTLVGSIQLHVHMQLQMYVQIKAESMKSLDWIAQRLRLSLFHETSCRRLCAFIQHSKISSTARDLLAAHTHHRCSSISQLHKQNLHLQGVQQAASDPPAEPAKWPHQPLHSPRCHSKPAKNEHSAYKAPMPLLLCMRALQQQMDCTA